MFRLKRAEDMVSRLEQRRAATDVKAEAAQAASQRAEHQVLKWQSRCAALTTAKHKADKVHHCRTCNSVGC